jgi:hypothetical protein
MARKRGRYPGYTLGWYLIGVINLAHCGEVVLAMLVLVGGGILLVISRVAGDILLGIAGFLFLVQVVSRVRHIRRLDHIRHKKGEVQVWSDDLRAWIGEARIERINRQEFHYPDAWRPISITLPGIEIHLSGIDDACGATLPTRSGRAA